VIDNAHVEFRARGCTRNGADLGLPIRETEAGAERLHAACRQEYRRTKRGGEKNAEPCVPEQGEVILPGQAARVKTCVPAGTAKRIANNFESPVGKYKSPR